MVYIRLDIVNKEEYETSDIYREIKILIPRDSEDLERDFEYLGLDYRNLDIQDTHIKECEIICKDDPDFSVNLTSKINNLIAKASKSGYTTPFNDMKELQSMISNLQSEERNKLLAILEVDEEHITNVRDVLRCVRNLDKYYLDSDSFSLEEYAENEIHLGGLYMEDVLPYINFKELGIDLLRERNAKLTQYGVLCYINEQMDKHREEELE